MRKYTKALVNIAVAVVLFLAVIIFLPKALVFLAPFVAGWIIALISGPLVRFFEEKVRIKRKIGSAFVIIVVIAAVVLLIYVIISQLVQQIIGLIGELPDMWASVKTDLENVGEKLSALLEKLPGENRLNMDDVMDQIGTVLGDFFGSLGTPTIAAAGNFAKQLPSIFIGVIMALLSSYFFVAEREQINEWFRKHTPVSVQQRYRTIRHSLVRSVGGYFKAQLKIEIWMYILLLVGLGALGVNYFALIALGIAFMDLLPFLGTGTILIPWAVIRFLAADYKMAVWLLIIWGGGQLARQLIQPKIVGDSMGIPPLPTLFLLFIGYRVGGVIGMIIAVPVGLLAYSMYEEGAFDTTKKSVMILAAGINRFRRLDQEDMFEVDEMMMRNKETAHLLEKQRQEEKLEKQTRREQKKQGKKFFTHKK